jgi:epoxyqueuosine reductase
VKSRGGQDSREAVERIKEYALRLGFARVGIARAESLQPEAERLDEWLTRGYAAGMEWISRSRDKRTDPEYVLPGCRSVVVVALNYYTPFAHDPARPRISRYAWGDDYHTIMGEKLRLFVKWMEEEFPRERELWYVDTGPVMEKAWAQRAGIGWIGKNTNLLTATHGSWLFLGEILTTLDLPPDPPATDQCGTCVACLEACPTGALVGPAVLDASLCLSYLTIEHRGEIVGPVREQFEGWIFGCDTCQDVCPWNERFAQVSTDPRFAPREGNLHPDVTDLASMTDEEFGMRFLGSPIRRAKADGLRRSIAIVQERQRPDV